MPGEDLSSCPGLDRSNQTGELLFATLFGKGTAALADPKVVIGDSMDQGATNINQCPPLVSYRVTSQIVARLSRRRRRLGT